MSRLRCASTSVWPGSDPKCPSSRFFTSSAVSGGAQQRVVAEVDHPDAQVIRRAPIRVNRAKLVLVHRYVLVLRVWLGAGGCGIRTPDFSPGTLVGMLTTGSPADWPHSVSRPACVAAFVVGISKESASEVSSVDVMVLCRCGHPAGLHTENGCRAGRYTPCRCLLNAPRLPSNPRSPRSARRAWNPPPRRSPKLSMTVRRTAAFRS